MKDLKISVIYDGIEYTLGTGIYNDIDEEFGISGLFEFVSLVSTLYLKDDNRTPLGSLGDFVAENFEKYRKDVSYYDILNDFYFEVA